MPSFKTPDGKEFATRTEWRDYMMATFYSYKNKKSETLMKKSGDIDGQGFDIADSEDSTLVVMDNCEQVQIDVVKNCRIFIGACASSIFIRNCTNCTFYTACRQLRLRDVKDCDFYIYSMSEVHIEFSSNVRFAPFNGGYPDQAMHFSKAKLDPKHNLWYDIFDHNDPLKSRVNWSLIPVETYEAPWFPDGPCEVAVPITKAGTASTVVVDSNAGLQAFGVEQMKLDAKTVPVVLPKQPEPVVIPPPPLPAPTLLTTPEKQIADVLAAFAAFKTGDDKKIFEAGFEYIKPDGSALTVDTLVGPGTVWAILSTTISASADLAWVTCLLETSGTVAKTTAVLRSHGDVSGWKLAVVQQSTGVHAAEVKIAKSS